MTLDRMQPCGELVTGLVDTEPADLDDAAMFAREGMACADDESPEPERDMPLLREAAVFVIATGGALLLSWLRPGPWFGPGF